jgi:hypothetical protein
MKELREKLIRIAYERPELRAKVLPTILGLEPFSVREASKKVKPTKVTFIEAVLEKPTDLTSWFAKQEGAPSLTGWDIKSHHMTMEFLGGKGSASDLKRYKSFLGNTYTLNIVGYVADASCVAVLVETNLPVKNKHPYITLAVNGVSPSYSNELIENAVRQGSVVKAKGKLRVKVGYFDGRGGGDKFELPHEFFETDEG